MPTSANTRLTLEVSDVQAEARDVVLVELRAPDGAPLPPFEPGAHLELDLGNRLVRHYSLTNDWRERDRYVIAVGRAADGRGGSQFVHQSVRRGSRLSVSAPRNHFTLDPHASGYVFVAGGIGVTPIIAMIRWCEAQARPWRLVYAVRSAQRAAFYESLSAYGPERLQFHFDDLRGGVLDVREALGTLAPGEQVYCCGPAPLMRAVASATAELPGAVAHFEYFSAPEDPEPAAAAGAFTIELQGSGASFQVPADKSILEVLEENGYELPFSCREGLCRTCETTVCAGEPDHRDYVLSDEERRAGKSMMICVSRALSPKLVLELL